MFQLVSVSAQNKGASWVVGQAPLVLGRDADVDIVLEEPLASRRHGRVFLRNGSVCYEDLGSRNEALLNGQPIRTGILNVGDELAIGRERFLLIQVTDAKVRVSRRPAQDTRSWTDGEPVFVDVDSAKPEVLGRPRTVQDLAWLYEVTRELSSSLSTANLFKALDTRLRDRFHPTQLWVLSAQGGTFTVSGGEQETSGRGEPRLQKLIVRAVEEKRGLLLPEALPRDGQQVLVCTMVSPSTVGSVTAAVIALQTEVPHGVYDEEDVQLLVLLCQSIAPAIVAMENSEQLERDNYRLRELADESVTLVGGAKGINAVRQQIAKIASTDLTVLITGETGTGKDVVARMIHANSARRHSKLVFVNCAAIPRELFEGELFGHEKGAFTGATEPSPGLIAEAEGGTLFLDEVGDLSPDNQARILHVVETRQFRRVGARHDVSVDMRIITATNKDLRAGIKSGAFREDLYHRLRGVEIALPPLRERTEDIPALVEHFLNVFRSHVGHLARTIDPDAIQYLQSLRWSGNIRELRNCIQRAVAMSSHATIQLGDVMETMPIQPEQTQEAGLVTLEDVEKHHIESVFRQCGGNIAETARILQIGRTTLYGKLAQYAIKQ